MSQNVLFMINSAPYGSERTFTALRLATTLANHDDKPGVRLFLLSDAIVAAVADQQIAEGVTLGNMLKELIGASVQVRVCKTCVAARGLLNAKWVDGVQIGTMPELADWTLWADKIITF